MSAELPDPEHLLLHHLAVKGTATAESLAAMLTLPLDATRSSLTRLSVEGLTRREREETWTLTAAGRSAHADLLAGPLAPCDIAAVHRTFKEFRVLNELFKHLCTRWQLRDDQRGSFTMNDHTDERYDGQIVAELQELHARTEHMLARGRNALPRLSTYTARLSAALDEIVNGDRSKFTTPLAGSYHDIWMELHEDLLLSLFLERSTHEA